MTESWTTTLSDEAKFELLKALYGYLVDLDYPKVWVGGEPNMGIEELRELPFGGGASRETLSGIRLVEDIHLLATLAESDPGAEDDLLYEVLAISAARQRNFLLPKDRDSLLGGYEMISNEVTSVPEKIDDHMWVVGRVCEAIARRGFRRPYVMSSPYR